MWLKMWQNAQNADYPRIDPLGLDGLLVRFAGAFSQRANQAALAFRTALEAADPDGVEEISGSLVGVYLRFDPQRLSHSTLASSVRDLLNGRDWGDEAAGGTGHLWRIPTVYGGEFGPQLGRAADLAGQSEAAAIETLASTRLRVMAIGFAPGQPYLGQFPEAWDLPRQTDLQTRVPSGALGVAVRQAVLFSSETQTGWYHVGRTAFACFRPDAEAPFPLKPGDEMMFPAVPASEFAALQADPASAGGARCEVLA